MSLRYPTALQAPWLSTPILVFAVTGRDVHGDVTTATTAVPTTGRVRRRRVEVMEAGARSLKAGISVYMPVLPNAPVDVGTILRIGGVDYAVQELLDRTNTEGEVLTIEVLCSVKPTEQVP
jgi:hypothetical protein